MLDESGPREESGALSDRVRESRERILLATFRVIARETISSTRVPAIAKEAGLSQGVLFYHFETKEKLLLELLDWLLDAFREYRSISSGQCIQPPASRTPANTQSTFLRYLRLLIEHDRSMIRVFYDFWVQAAGGSGPFEETLKQQFRIYRDDVKGILTDGTRSGAEADVTAGIIVSLFEGAALQLALDPEAFDVGRYLDRVARILDGICSRPEVRR